MPEKNVIPLVSARPATLAASQPRDLQLAQTLLREIDLSQSAKVTALVIAVPRRERDTAEGRPQ